MFIVVYDDRDLLCLPLVWDKDREGAISAGFLVDNTEMIAIFDTRKAARVAINISVKFAELCKEQGKPANEDFLAEGRKNIRILRCGVKKVNKTC